MGTFSTDMGPMEDYFSSLSRFEKSSLCLCSTKLDFPSTLSSTAWSLSLATVGEKRVFQLTIRRLFDGPYGLALGSDPLILIRFLALWPSLSAQLIVPTRELTSEGFLCCGGLRDIEKCEPESKTMCGGFLNLDWTSSAGGTHTCITSVSGEIIPPTSARRPIDLDKNVGHPPYFPNLNFLRLD